MNIKIAFSESPVGDVNNFQRNPPAGIAAVVSITPCSFQLIVPSVVRL
jgi:hypothetical protein